MDNGGIDAPYREDGPGSATYFWVKLNGQKVTNRHTPVRWRTSRSLTSHASLTMRRDPFKCGGFTDSYQSFNGGSEIAVTVTVPTLARGA